MFFWFYVSSCKTHVIGAEIKNCIAKSARLFLPALFDLEKKQTILFFFVTAFCFDAYAFDFLLG